MTQQVTASAGITLSVEEMVFATRLRSFAVHARRNQEASKAACKAIGQEIFNTAKMQTGDCVEGILQGRDSTERVYNYLRLLNPALGQYVESAWNGIGEDRFRWAAF